MLRSFVLLMSLVVIASVPTPAFAAQTSSGGGATGCASVIGREQSAPTGSTAFGPGPAPIQVPAGVHMPQLINEVRGEETRRVWTDEKGRLHIEGTIDYHGTGLRMPAGASNGGHVASVGANTCTQWGSNAPEAFNTVCWGTCLTQHQKWTVLLYSNDADTINTYYQRVEVRVWWTSDSYPRFNDLNGAATTTFQEYMTQCNGSDWLRDTYSSWYPAWQTETRTYDYYWDETWMPIMGGPGDRHMLVKTDTPTTVGTNLFTQQIFN